MAVVHAMTFDCSDALAQATFWAAMLNWDVAPDGNEDVAMVGGPRRPPFCLVEDADAPV